MDVESIKSYLEPILGETLLFSGGEETIRLPLFLRRYQLLFVRLQGRAAVFAFVRADEQTPLEYLRYAEKLYEVLEKPVIFIFEYLATSKRNALISNRVPFIIPGRQFYFPPMLDLKEWAARPVVFEEFLSYPAQVIVLRELLFADVGKFFLKELAGLCGFSAMSISTAAAELCKRNLAAYSEEKRPKSILFHKHGKELWEETLPLMRSPVQKKCLNKLIPEKLPLSGVSALSRFSMLAPDGIRSCAANKAYLKSGPEFQEASSRDDAESILEIWHYAPVWGNENCVDKFSLYLSMKDAEDPRIEECLEEMLEKWEW